MLKIRFASVLLTSGLILFNCSEPNGTGETIIQRPDGFLTTESIESKIKSNIAFSDSAQCEYRLRTNPDDPVFYPLSALQLIRDGLNKNQSVHVALNCPVDEMGTTTHYFVGSNEHGRTQIKEVTLRKAGKAYGFHSSVEQRDITNIESSVTTAGETVLKFRSEDGKTSAIAADNPN